MTVYNITVESDVGEKTLVRHAVVFADRIEAAEAYGLGMGLNPKARVVVEPQQYDHQKQQNNSKTILV